MLRHASLDRDDAKAVRHHVVHLTGDAQPLFGDAPLSLLLRVSASSAA